MSVGVCEECGTETTVRYWESELVCRECAEALNGGPVLEISEEGVFLT